MNIDKVIDDVLIDIGAKQPIPEAKPYHEWDDIVEWIQKYFYLYDTATLLTLEKPQIAPLREALRREADGRFVYDRVLWSWMKKSAKSTIIAAVVDYMCFHKPRSMWRLVANDLKQADSRVGMYLRSNIELGAALGYGDNDPTGIMRQFRKSTRIKPSGYTIEYPNNSKVEMVPVDPAGESGGNDDGTVFSELWAWKHKAHQLMYTEMTISSTRFGFAQQWIDTYAGFTGESPILETLYKHIVKDENRLDIAGNDECYSKDGVFATWVTKPCLSWQTKRYYRSERIALAPSQFRRMHRNEWVTSEDTFVTPEMWHNCQHKQSSIPKLGKYDLVQMALDAAISSDCFGIVAVSRPLMKWQLANGYAETDEVFIVRYARRWIPPKDSDLRFYGDDSPQSELDRLTTSYNVQQVAYDPYQLEHFASEQRDKGYAWYEKFNQGADRLRADKFLYDTIRAKRLIHFGDPILTSHVLGANRKVSDTTGLRLVKRNEELKIDLAVALSMAVYRAKDTLAK